MGSIVRARRIQDEALDLYRQTSVVIDPALIRLDAALGYAMSGFGADGCQLAENVLDELPAEHRTRIVAIRVIDVLDALPAGHRHIPSAAALRALVSTETTPQ
ncbi:hypothetical protein APR12_004372 [Nocardia amikacinitolerans]|uniref:hypothetical protein n=1 Tax=Nocardia amikacinitolerans TaxID=756689 RepID=UPI00082D9521|nr:hypothetical protein [Nocardia amikacinitolerans]MCP2319009.1 hypothetical protein [Nocardia amikacinitolerans]